MLEGGDNEEGEVQNGAGDDAGSRPPVPEPREHWIDHTPNGRGPGSDLECVQKIKNQDLTP